MPFAVFSDRSLRYCSCVRLIYDSKALENGVNLVDVSHPSTKKIGITSAIMNNFH